MPNRLPSYFRLHLIFDATGESSPAIAGGSSAVLPGTPHRARAPTGAHGQTARAGLERGGAGARHRSLSRRSGADRGDRAPLPRAEGAVAARPAAHHERVQNPLSGRRRRRCGRPPAHGRRGLFPPHRRAQLFHGPRRRPAAAGSQLGRHHHPRHLAHVQDADQHLLAQRGYKTANLPWCRASSCRRR